MIAAGKMRFTGVIQEISATRGSLGQLQYQTFATARGELKTFGRVAGKEVISPRFIGSEVDFIFVTRYIPGVKGNMRLVIGSRTFTVIFPENIPEGAPRQTELYLREIMTA